jgi:hypothetical protein
MLATRITGTGDERAQLSTNSSMVEVKGKIVSDEFHTYLAHHPLAARRCVAAYPGALPRPCDGLMGHEPPCTDTFSLFHFFCFLFLIYFYLLLHSQIIIFFNNEFFFKSNFLKSEQIKNEQI